MGSSFTSLPVLSAYSLRITNGEMAYILSKPRVDHSKDNSNQGIIIYIIIDSTEYIGNTEDSDLDLPVNTPKLQMLIKKNPPEN